MLNDTDLADIERAFVSNDSGGTTHWEDCHTHHYRCAIAKLVAEVRELRAAIFDNCAATIQGDTVIQEWARKVLYPQ